MKGIVLSLFILFAIVFLLEKAHGHAVLLKPSPWWRAASRERPCGGGEYNPQPSAVWEMGSVQTLKWWVIALDGAGNVSARIDTAGNANFDTTSRTVFSVPVVQPIGLIRSMGFHNIMPSVNCTGPAGTCTMQFWVVGGGGWYTCTTVNITCKGCAPVIKPVIPDVCVTAADLSFCSYKSLTQVKIPDGSHAVGIDKSVRESYELNQPNTNVFANGTSAECKANFRELLCEYYLPPCGNSSSAFGRQRCQKVLDQDCKIQSTHKYLYNCTKFRNDSEIAQVYVPPAPAVTASPSSNSSAASNSSASVPNQPYVPPDNSSASSPSSNSSAASNSSSSVPSQPYVPPDNSSASQPNVPPSHYYPPSPPSPNVPASTPSPTSTPSTTKTSSSTTTSSSSSTTKSSSSSTTKTSSSSTTSSSTTS